MVRALFPFPFVAFFLLFLTRFLHDQLYAFEGGRQPAGTVPSTIGIGPEATGDSRETLGTDMSACMADWVEREAKVSIDFSLF